MRQCKKCLWVNHDTDNICTSCGNDISQDHNYVCNNCGMIFNENVNFCSNCGTGKNVSNNDTKLKQNVDRLIKELNIGKTKHIIEGGLATAVAAATEGVIKTKEFLNEENLEKVKSAGEAGLNKAKEYVNEENLNKLKDAGKAGLEKVEKIGQSLVTRTDTVPQEATPVYVPEVMPPEKKESSVTSKHICSWLGCFVAAAILGALLNFFLAAKPKPYDPTEMLSKLNYSKAIDGKEMCTVNSYDAVLLDSPSSFSGKVIMSLAYGNKVEFLKDVPSIERDKNQAITSGPVTWFELFRKNLKIPEGVHVQINGMNNGNYVGSFYYEGKNYTRNFHDYQLKIPYVGNYRLVKIDGKDGYIRADKLTAPKFM